MSAVEYAICEVLRDGRPVGLGFAVDASHVVTCAHVVNAALGRSARDSSDPGRVELPVQFPIGRPVEVDGRHVGALVEWLPTVADGFDVNDLALLELTEPVADFVPMLNGGRHRPPMKVQMWGPQDFRPDGGHVTGELLGEVPGGRIQINVNGGPFRVRPGFSGGPVWQPGTLRVIGILVACGREETAVDAYMLGMDRVGEVWPGWAPVDEDARFGSGRGEDLYARVAANTGTSVHTLPPATLTPPPPALRRSTIAAGVVAVAVVAAVAVAAIAGTVGAVVLTSGHNNDAGAAANIQTPVATTTQRPTANPAVTPTTTTDKPTTQLTTQTVACLGRSEALAAADVISHPLPADAQIVPGSLRCESGWALAKLGSSKGSATAVYRRENGQWHALTLGTGLCDNGPLPELADAPAWIHAAVGC